MTDPKQNRRSGPAARVDSVAAENANKLQKQHTWFLPLPSIGEIHADLFIPLCSPSPRLHRLKPQEILDYASTPNLRDLPVPIAEIYAQLFSDGCTILYWPRDVTIVVQARGINPLQGLALYHAARDALENHLQRG